jgi:serine/threonine protein kinase
MVDNIPDPTTRKGVGSDRITASNLLSRRPDPLLGTVFAERYSILEVLGRGGMGVVYKARHDLMDRIVAIKMMLPQLVSDEVSLARFQREARAASKINHPNIIAIHDFGLTADTGVAYLVMDYIEGQTLGDAIKKDGQLGVVRAARIFLQVCDALQHAHKLGVIHRDMKPSNIMLVNQGDKEDVVKVVDFGVAKIASSENDMDQQRLTTTGEIFGSPVYMSPEQCIGESLDSRSDIYALGCVLYEAVTGKPPCAGKNAIETIARHMNTTPEPFGKVRADLYIPEWLERIVFKALSKDPAQRQQTMQEFFDELFEGVSATSSPAQMKQISNSLTTSLRTQAVPGDSQQWKAVSPKAAATTGKLKPTAAPNHGGSNKLIWAGVAVGFLAALTAGAALLWYAQGLTQKAAPQATPPPIKAQPEIKAQPTTNTPSNTTVTPPADPPRTLIEPAVTPVAPTIEPATVAPTERPRKSVVVMPKAAKVVKPHTHVQPTVEPDPPAAHHRHRSDYYDFSVGREHSGSPVDLPGH